LRCRSQCSQPLHFLFVQRARCFQPGYAVELLIRKRYQGRPAVLSQALRKSRLHRGLYLRLINTACGVGLRRLARYGAVWWARFASRLCWRDLTGDIESSDDFRTMGRSDGFCAMDFRFSVPVFVIARRRFPALAF
jgi:hypothetical protein